MDSETIIAEAKLPLHSLVFQIHVPKYVGEGFFSQIAFLRQCKQNLFSLLD